MGGRATDSGLSCQSCNEAMFIYITCQMQTPFYDARQGRCYTMLFGPKQYHQRPRWSHSGARIWRRCGTIWSKEYL